MCDVKPNNPLPSSTDQYATGECILSPAVFRRHIVPQLLRILHVHDAHIRLVLLRHFSRYVAEIPRHLLGDVVLPEVRRASLPPAGWREGSERVGNPAGSSPCRLRRVASLT